MPAYRSRFSRIFARTAGAMRSGRLCSSGGRQATSSELQPFARLSAATSRASAPQAMTRILGSMGERAAFGEEPLRRFDRDRRVAAIGVGADGLAEFLVEGRAPDQHDVLVAQVL